MVCGSQLSLPHCGRRSSCRCLVAQILLRFERMNAHATIKGTKDVRLDPQLNKKVWESGIKGVPFRLRVRISRKRNDEEGAKEKLYSYVQAVNVKDPKGLQTTIVED